MRLSGQIKTPPFSKEARLEAGSLLRRLQEGELLEMNKNQKQALEAAGFDFEDAEDFLKLTAEERKLVELRVAVSRSIRKRRERQHLTQADLAKRMKTSQPRIARIESGSRGVSLDLMFRGLFALGGTMKDVQIANYVKLSRGKGVVNVKMKRPGPQQATGRLHATDVDT